MTLAHGPERFSLLLPSLSHQAPFVSRAVAPVMDRTRAVCLLLLRRRRRRRQKLRRNRSLWVHPINQRRDEAGAFATLFHKFRQDGTKFFNYFHMSISSFDELLGKVRNHIQHENTQMRNCIQPELRLAITLRYIASGCTFTNLHYTFRIGISTATKIVRNVCRAIWSVMKAEVLPVPRKEHWESIAAGFEKKANFPNCLGAVDGKYIRLVRPFKIGSMYYNNKEYFSVVLIAIADSEYRFVYVDIGIYGKDCNSSIFQRSKLWTSVVDENLQLPSEKCLHGANRPLLPYFFIGDEAFGLHKHLLRPFGGRNLSVPKRVFNYRLRRGQRYVECAFGILSNKWRILHRPINVHPDFGVDIVKCCVALHNFVRDRDGFALEDTMSIIGLEDVEQQSTTVRGRLSANNIRNTLCDYFMSPVGSVPWQMTKI